MAFSPSPSSFFGAGYSLSANKVQMTTATAGSNVLLTKLTDAEANSSSGDYREIVWSICSAFYDKWAAVAPVSRPAKVNMSKGVKSNPDLVTQTETFTFTFITNVDPTNVAAE